MTQLPLIVKRELQPVPETDWAKLVDEALAVRYACEHSGLQDKSIAIECGIDGALLSRAKAGQIRLNDDALHALMACTGCEAPLIAHLLRCGYDPRSLRKLETETERALRESNERCAQLENDKRVLIEALRGNPA